MGKIHQGIAHLNLASLIMGLLFLGGQAMAAEEYSHPGYLDDVRDERFEVTKEVIIMPLTSDDSPMIMDKIFTEKLTKKFRKEFRDQFGYTEFEQIEVTPNRFEDLGGSSGRLLPVTEHIEKQEAFGQYMAKELLQYHVDNYLKSSEQTRTIYKMKEAVSNIEIASKNGTKYKIKYNIASNRINFAAIKPKEIIHKQIDLKMGSQLETVVRLGYDVSKSVRLGTDYSIEKQVLSVRGDKRLTSELSTSIVGQDYNKDLDENTPKQERILLGLTWND